MSREALAIGSDTKPPVLFRGDYSQWKDRFLDFLERQEDWEQLKDSLDNGPKKFYAPQQALPENSPAIQQEQIVLKYHECNADQKKRLNADKRAKSYIMQGMTNDIYTQVDSYTSAKEMWDAIARQQQGSERGQHTKMTHCLQAYEGFKAKAGELLEGTYNRYCLLLNEVRKNKFQK